MLQHADQHGSADAAPVQVDPNQPAPGSKLPGAGCGVDLKLHLGIAPTDIANTLIKNVVKTRRWPAQIVEGKTFAGSADFEGISNARVKDVAELAPLAPDVTNAIAVGEQPDNLNTDYLVKTDISAIWSEQVAIFAKL